MTEEMPKERRKLFAAEGLQGEFIISDILDWKPTEQYDMVVSQTLLRHVNCGERFLQKMIEFLTEGGLLVSMKCNWEFDVDDL